MGTRPRLKPDRLAEKLLAIRKHLRLSQSQLARLLDVEVSSARICEYESGAKEPNLLALLRYSEAGRVHMEALVDDRVSLKRFREGMGRRRRSR